MNCIVVKDKYILNYIIVNIINQDFKNISTDDLIKFVCRTSGHMNVIQSGGLLSYSESSTISEDLSLSAKLHYLTLMGKAELLNRGHEENVNYYDAEEHIRYTLSLSRI